MQAKIAIAFGVVVALFIGFMTYRHFQQKESNRAYKEDTYSRMTEMAQKSSEAGLAYMGMAIKNYQREKNEYPPELAALYPDYIQDKSFIEEVAWEYTPGEKNFRLAKTINRQTAYIDNNLSPRSEKKEVQVAARQNKSSSSARQHQAAGAQEKTDRSQRYARLQPSEERQYSQEELSRMREKLLKDLTSGKLSQDNYGWSVFAEPKRTGPIYTVAEGTGNLPGGLGDHYLAWKNQDGTIGFGNVMYPDLHQNSAYQEGRWFRAKHPQTEASSNLPEDYPTASKANEELAGKYGNQYLTWKDSRGSLGFGNIMYPEERSHLVYTNGSWITPPAEAPETIKMDGQNLLTQNVSNNPDTIAAKHGQTYLTWKSPNGAIGFGNVMYPQAQRYSVYQNGQWLETESGTTASGEKMPGEEQASISYNDLWKKYENRFYVWQSPSGALGFGNINYPDQNAGPLSFVRDNNDIIPEEQ